MLEPDQWESILATVTGSIYRGTERIASAALLNLLQVSQDKETRQKAGKRIVSTMRSLGWSGPKPMRLGRGEVGSGYWRIPFKPPEFGYQAGADDPDGLSDDLPTALEQGTRIALRKLVKVLRLPTGSDGNVLRAQVTAGGILINAQLRADEQRLRAKVTGDVLERLLAAIERERRKDQALSLGDAAGDGIGGKGSK